MVKVPSTAENAEVAEILYMEIIYSYNLSKNFP